MEEGTFLENMLQLRNDIRTISNGKESRLSKNLVEILFFLSLGQYQEMKS